MSKSKPMVEIFIAINEIDTFLLIIIEIICKAIKLIMTSTTLMIKDCRRIINIVASLEAPIALNIPKSFSIVLIFE